MADLNCLIVSNIDVSMLDTHEDTHLSIILEQCVAKDAREAEISRLKLPSVWQTLSNRDFVVPVVQFLQLDVLFATKESFKELSNFQKSQNGAVKWANWCLI